MTSAHARTTNPWLVLVLVCIAQFMVVLDATIVNVAMPAIGRDLQLGETDLQWIVNAYALMFGGFLLLGGRAGDLIGRKKIFLAGVALFTIASLLNGLATSSGMLIAFRGLQGLGAALVAPAALSIVTTSFAEGPERTKAMGVWGAIAAGGGAVGLLLGGILTDALSWEWIFFINVPVGIAAFLLSLRFVPESRDEAMHRSFDLAGAVTVTGGLVALVYAIVQANDAGWTSATTLGFGALALVLLGSFFVIESRAKAPLVRLSIFRVPTIAAANTSMFLVAAGLFAMFFFSSLYIQQILGYSPIEAGLAFLPFTAGIVVAAGSAQQLIPRLGVRATSLVGISIATGGMLWLSTIGPQGSYVADLLGPILMMSFGMGLTFVPMTLVATSGIETDDAGLASGLFNTSQQIGGALGLAVLTTIAVNVTDANVAASSSPVERVAATVDGYSAAFMTGSAFMVAGAIAIVAILRRRHVEAIDADPATVPVA
ncbi:MAG: MFS transporter [Pseudomonadota bacterium]